MGLPSRKQRISSWIHSWSWCRTGSRDGEERWQSIGMVAGILLLLVAHTIDVDLDTEGEAVEVFRIISARPATKAERVRYESENR